jgi:hypothetical protein
MRAFLLLSGVFTAALIAVSPVHAAAGGASCHAIVATGVGQDLGGGMTTAQISNGGLLQGTTAASFAIVDVSGFPVLGISGAVTFTTNKGTLTVAVTGSFNVSTGDFAASGPVAGATGKLEGATGSLAFAGVENLTTGVFTETVTGSICVDLSP